MHRILEQHMTSSGVMHAKYAALVLVEQHADKCLRELEAKRVAVTNAVHRDKYSQWEQANDARTDYENVILKTPFESEVDIELSLKIMARRFSAGLRGPDLLELLKGFAERHLAYIRRHCSM